MNLEALASDIASRIPAMAQDTPINNAEMIKRMFFDAIYDEKAVNSVYGKIIRAGLLVDGKDAYCGVIVEVDSKQLEKLPENLLYRGAIVLIGGPVE